MTDLATLGIRVDSSDVAAGAADLDRLGQSAKRARDAAREVGPAYAITGKQAAAAAYTAAIASVGQTQSIKVATIGVREALAQTGTATRAAAAAQGQHSQALGAATLSAKQYSQALRLLPAQITDVVTGLASGQSPFLVAIQQGGQLRDSFGGVGNALRAVGTLITPARLAIGATAGAAAILAKALFDAQAESFALSKAIALSGNSAGVTTDRLRELAADIDEFVGTQAAASATLAQLVSTGRVAARNLEEFATVALNLERTTAQPIAETVKAFAELGRKPVEAALKLNEMLNFLTIETYQSIRALEDQGRTFEAGEAAQKAYALAMTDRTRKLDEELGILQRAARGTGEFFSEMWDQILNVGRPDTLQQQIAQAAEKLRQLDSYVARFPGASRASNPNIDQDRAALAAQLDGLRALKTAQQDGAKSDAARKQALDRLVESEKEAIKVTDARRALIEEIARQRFTVDTSALQRGLEASLSGYSAYTGQLEALRAADLVSDEDYYAAKRALVERDADLRERALRDESAKVTAELARLKTARDAASRAALEAPGGRESDRIKAESPFNKEIAHQQERIKNNEAEIAQLRIRSAAALGTLTVEQQASTNTQVRALTAARTAAQAYLETLERANDRKLEAFGLGERAREIADARNDVEDRFADQRRDLENERARLEAEGRFTAQARQQYQDRLAIIEEFNQSALDATDRYYDDLAAKESSAAVGARQAFANLRDSAANVAQQTADAFGSAFDGMTDALAEFAQTGKLDFKQLANAIIADLLRIQIQAALTFIFQQVFGSIGGIAGAIGGTGAGGGTVPTAGAPLHAATGIKRVPRDNQPAILHKDEAVIPAAMNPYAGGRSPWQGQNITVHQTVTPMPGVSLAQVQAIVREANADLALELIEGSHRGRWGTA